jgi:hypothetical protein
MYRTIVFGLNQRLLNSGAGKELDICNVHGVCGWLVIYGSE